MTNNTNNSPRINHRDNCVKNIVIVVLLVLLLCVLAYVAIISRNYSSLRATTVDSCVCGGASFCNKCDEGNADGKLCELYAKLDALNDEKSKLEAELQDAQDEINALKYENASLKSSSSIDLSNYVLSSTYNALEKKYNALVATHSNCRNVDLSQYVTKSAYNELNAKYNGLVATHANCKNVDLSKYVTKEDYEILNIRYENLLINYNKVKDIDLSKYVAKKDYDELQAKYDEFYKKWNGHKCVFFVSDHSDCVSASKYDALVDKYNELDRNYRDLCDKWNNHVCSGQTIVEADHSSCVSLRDYRELEAKYNELLNKQNNNTSSRPIYVDENGNIINP